MKTDFHFKLISRVIVLAILVIVVFAMQRSVDTVAEDTPVGPTEIAGWAWSPITGWVSLNCLNDFDGDQILENFCGLPYYAYNLAIEYTVPDDPHITGCAWSGNNAGGAGKPLGWICFSDPPAGGTGALPDGVPTSSSYINALEPNTAISYASILAFQAVDLEATKIGFPIAGADISGGIDSDNPINGCFNCFTEKTYGCLLSADSCDACLGGDDSCDDQDACPDQADPPLVNLCIVKSTEDHCDNCLDYDYYNGRCSVTTTISCQNSDDCPDYATGEICEQIKSCLDAFGEIVDCTDDTDDCDVPLECIERDIGEFKSVIGGYACHQCEIQDFDNTVEMSSYDTNINSCNACDIAHNTPGVMFDNQNGYVGSDEQLPPDPADCYLTQDDMQAEDFCHRAHLGGWGWNAWDDGGVVHGLGWFQFSPRITTSSKPYFSVERGSIYSLGNIFSRYSPPFGRANAAYLIESSGAITNFVSFSTLYDDYQGELEYRPDIDFLNQNTGADENRKYDNALGSLDAEAFTVDYDGTGRNKFGSTIVNNADLTFELAVANGLQGKVFTTPGDYDLSGDIAIKKGNNTNGSGIVVINGDLTILDGASVTYDSLGIINFLSEIPSLVWVVKGDVVIEGGVEEIVGTFIVLRADGSICDPYIVSEDDITIPPRNSCGRFDTCDQDLDCGDQLKVTGNVLAKQFDMGRDFRNPDKEASELFQNDGRLQANPPPGLTDFSKVIPRFTDNPY